MTFTPSGFSSSLYGMSSSPLPRFSNTPKTPSLHEKLEAEACDDLPRKDKAPQSLRNILIIFAVAGLVTLAIVCFGSPSRPRLDRIPETNRLTADYFDHFQGHQDCGIASTDLYSQPPRRANPQEQHLAYCPNRAALLEAFSGGGRHGFDAPFFPAACHYRWYSTAEICMILDRFDTIFFIGDHSLKHIYAAFNMLLRENLDMGGVKQWEMTESQRDGCRCDSQIVKEDCSRHIISSSEEVTNNDGSRTPHMFLPVTGSPAGAEELAAFTARLALTSDSYKPLPVIHSLSLSTSLSWPLATASMDEWLSVADSSGRAVPFMWIGPNAAGHLKPPGQILSQGNNALWHYTIETAKEANSRQVEPLGMYNMTLQASSWDGSYYGSRVALVQAMMIINWLSRLETS